MAQLTFTRCEKPRMSIQITESESCFHDKEMCDQAGGDEVGYRLFT